MKQCEIQDAPGLCNMPPLNHVPVMGKQQRTLRSAALQSVLDGCALYKGPAKNMMQLQKTETAGQVTNYPRPHGLRNLPFRILHDPNVVLCVAIVVR
jgi:hypothetical protein